MLSTLGLGLGFGGLGFAFNVVELSVGILNFSSLMGSGSGFFIFISGLGSGAGFFFGLGGRSFLGDFGGFS